jgi:hypothetical protein
MNKLLLQRNTLPSFFFNAFCWYRWQLSDSHLCCFSYLCNWWFCSNDGTVHWEAPLLLVLLIHFVFWVWWERLGKLSPNIQNWNFALWTLFCCSVSHLVSSKSLIQNDMGQDKFSSSGCKWLPNLPLKCWTSCFSIYTYIN